MMPIRTYDGVACAILLILALWWDIKTHRIPNLLIVFGLAMSATSIRLTGGVGAANAAIGFLAGLAVFVPLYALRLLGAGDVKLLATVGTFVGYPGVLWVALCTAMAGGILSFIGMMVYSESQKIWLHLNASLSTLLTQFPNQKIHAFPVLKDSQKKLPYALCIGLGTLTYAMFGNDFYQ